MGWTVFKDEFYPKYIEIKKTILLNNINLKKVFMRMHFLMYLNMIICTNSTDKIYKTLFK